MGDIVLTNKPTLFTPVLRVYEIANIPMPSPHNNLQMVTTFKDRENNDITIPCFYNQILSVSLDESIQGEVSANITFPYLPTLSGSSTTPYEKELEVLYPKEGLASATIPYFTVSQLTPKYLYKLSFIKGAVRDTLDSLYDNISALNDYIDTNEEVSYWLYLSDYQINQNSKQKTMTLIFTDIGYKLKSNWSYIFPTKEFFNWALTNNTGNNLLSDFLANNSKAYAPVFDGWKLPGVLLALLYQSNLFPYNALLDNITLSTEVSGDYTTYKLTSDGNTYSIMKIDTGLTEKEIPISELCFPDKDDIVSEGYYYSISPYKYFTDIINDLESTIGFFWRFNRDGVLEISDTYYIQTEDVYIFNGSNSLQANYDYDDSNLRNHIFVFGMPMSPEEKVQAEAEDADSIAEFGRRPFVFEFPLILTEKQAQDVANNILSTYAFNIGTVNVNFAFDSSILVGNKVKLDIDDNFTTGTKTLVISSLSLKYTALKPMLATINLIPQTNRVSVEIPAGFTNVSYLTTFERSAVSYEFEADTDKVSTKVYLTDGQTIDTTTRNTTLNCSWKTERIADDVICFISNNYWYKLKENSATFTFKYTDKNNNPQTITYNYSGESRKILIQVYVFPASRNSGSPVYIDSTLKITVAGTEVYNDSVSISVNDSVTVTVTETSALGVSVQYSEFILGEHETIRMKYHINNTSNTNGLIEGGFLIVPTSILNRDDNGVPFNGATLSGSDLSVNNVFSNYGVFETINKIDEYKDIGFLYRDGDISSMGSLQYLAGIDLDSSVANISELVKNMLFSIKAEDISDSYELEFNPYIEASDELLCYANVFLVVPYFMFTSDSGRRLYPDDKVFIVHVKLPSVENRPIIQGYDPADENNYTVFTSVYLNNYKKYPIAKFDNSTYKISDIKDANLKIEIKETTMYRYFKFKYKSSFPFTLYMGIAHGDRTRLWHNLKKSTYRTVNLIHKRNLNDSDTLKLVSDFYPFLNIQDIAKWYEDNIGNEEYAPLFLFINPFYRYSLDYLIEKISNDDSFDADSKFLALFGLMSDTDTTPTDVRALGYIQEGANERYALSVSDTAPEVGMMFFNADDI